MNVIVKGDTSELRTSDGLTLSGPRNWTVERIQKPPSPRKDTKPPKHPFYLKDWRELRGEIFLPQTPWLYKHNVHVSLLKVREYQPSGYRNCMELVCNNHSPTRALYISQVGPHHSTVKFDDEWYVVMAVRSRFVTKKVSGLRVEYKEPVVSFLNKIQDEINHWTSRFGL